MYKNCFSLFIVMLMSLLSGNFAVAETLPPHNTPHFQLAPVSSSSAPSIKLAAIYWLPDYLKDNLGKSINPDPTPIDPNPGRCGTYGMVESCGYPKVSTGEKLVSENLKCQKGCVCPDSYQYTSANCNGDQELGGSVCEGKYNQCNNKPCPTSQPCPYGCKTYSSMSHCSSVCVECATDPCPGYYECGGSWQYCTGRKCAADSSKCSTYCPPDSFPNKCDNSSDCNGIYRNGYCSGSCVPADPCAGVSCGANAYCSSGSCYCNSGYSKSGGTCVKNCTPSANETGCSYGTQSCSDGCGGTRTCCKSAPSDPCAGVSCGANAYCSSGTCYCNSGYSKSGGICVANHTHSYACPSGYSATNSWGTSAQTAAKTCSCGETSGTCYKAPGCVSGGSASCSGQTSACSSSQVQTSSCKDCAGNTHYSCRNKNDTCSSGSKTPCSSSQVQTSTSTTEAGSTCYLCRAKTCEDYGYSDTAASGYNCTSKFVSELAKFCYTSDCKICKKDVGPCANGCAMYNVDIDSADIYGCPRVCVRCEVTVVEPSCEKGEVQITCKGLQYCCGSRYATCYYTETHYQPDGTVNVLCRPLLSSQEVVEVPTL